MWEKLLVVVVVVVACRIIVLSPGPGLCYSQRFSEILWLTLTGPGLDMDLDRRLQKCKYLLISFRKKKKICTFLMHKSFMILRRELRVHLLIKCLMLVWCKVMKMLCMTIFQILFILRAKFSLHKCIKNEFKVLNYTLRKWILFG